MAEASSPSPTLFVKPPPLAFRVGITGAIGLDAAAQERLRGPIAAVLTAIQTKMLDIAARPNVPFFRDPDGRVRPKLRVVSPTAPGADQLVAEEALRLKYELEIVLPFAQVDYEKTFAGDADVEAFRVLLAKAGPRVLVLDGDADDHGVRARSYGAAGHFVVRNCDLLIAIWDPSKPAKGAGGTADTIAFAARAGLPVWWLHADGTRPPRLITNAVEAAQPEDCESDAAKLAAWLQDYMEATVAPPAEEGAAEAGLRRRLFRWFRRRIHAEGDTLQNFLAEKQRASHWMWNAHATIVGGIAGTRGKKGSGSQATAASSHPAAALARHYQSRYRSSYVYVFLLAAVIAFVSALVGLGAAETNPIATAAELLMLLVVGMIVVANHLDAWRERYVSYRLLAELMRKQRPLAQLGWSLPIHNVTRMTARSERAWVGWYFAAEVRAASLPSGTFGNEQLRAIRDAISTELLGRQIEYHEDRNKKSEAAYHRLGRVANLLFLATLLVVIAKLYLLTEHAGEAVVPVLGFLAGLLPTTAAALFGIRAYEEFEVLAEQSAQMAGILTTAHTHIRQIKFDRPLESQLLAAEVFAATEAMLADVTGWVQLFRMKAVEG